MSAEDETPKPSTRDESSDSGSESDASSDDGPKIEWLATGRAKRSTAGNRMKTMLANEEPDSDLELLFAEDEDDQGFEDDEANASDVHMDSSSDDEDEQNAGDDLEGEKQLEKEARERKAAARKRKAQEAIPAKFRKKVRIQPGGPAQAPAPAPRPRKKSERLSWLPSPTDAPTRASQRSTTRMSKEQLHEQMKEREARRLKQVALMEKRQRQMEARKKPPMTQEERLAEAALVEKRNSKSLNRWEVAEKQREEERRAKLAALNNRTLRGPVITFWSGRGEWEEGREGEGGAYHITIAEKPKKKRLTAAEKEREKELKEKELKEKEKKGDASPPTPTTASNRADAAADAKPESGSEVPPPEADAQTQNQTTPESKEQDAKPPTPAPAEPSTNTASSGLSVPSLFQDPPQPESRAPLMAPPSMEPRFVPIEGAKPKPLAALLAIETSTGPQSSVLAAPVLAPPAGLSPTILGGGSYSTPSSPKSNVLAPPNTTQRPSPLSLPPSTPAAPTQAASKPQTLAPKPANTQEHANTTDPPKPQDASGTPKPADLQVSAAEANASRTRTAMILQNFDESVIKDKVVQTQILFGRKMSRLQKPQPHPLCVITNQPARYRDPKTGLPYRDARAYREIRRLAAGEFRWSALLGCWVGDGEAAKGVPARFIDPTAPAPVKEKEKEKEKEMEKEKEIEKEGDGTGGGEAGDNAGEKTGNKTGEREKGGEAGAKEPAEPSKGAPGHSQAGPAKQQDVAAGKAPEQSPPEKSRSAGGDAPPASAPAPVPASS